MKNICKDVWAGKYDECKVWVVDYRLNTKNICNRPARLVKPTQVFVQNTPGETGALLYTLNKKRGLGKIIPFFDTSGNKYRTGVSLAIYETKEEAIRHWNDAVRANQEKLEGYKETIMKEIDNLKNKYEEIQSQLPGPEGAGFQEIY